jgi:hypothetical protein
VITHLRGAPQNAKIGDMSQAWIMPVETSPNEAVSNGDDEAVCGSCQFRPALGGGCYVQVPFTSHRVWWAWQKFGSYKPIEQLPDLTDAKPMRIGAWGDPMAVPAEAWQRLFDAGLGRWTAYTSQWTTASEVERAWWQRWAMASCKSAEEAAEAQALGWRTYRARLETDPLQPNELVCPAAEESPSHGVTCAKCHICDGVSRRIRKNVAIVVHGRSHARGAAVVGGQ